MKTCLLLFACILFADVHYVKCQSRWNSDSTQLLQLEDQLAKCYVKYDAKIVEQLVAKDFIYSENDQTYTRDEVLHQLASGTDKMESAKNEDMLVHLHGSTALITGWLIIRGSNAEGLFERRYRYTDIWMKMKDGWQIIGAHDFIK